MSGFIRPEVFGPEWRLTKPFPKPFESLRKAERAMTTVIAIQARDGLVIGSDLQRTGTAKEFVPKLKGLASREGSAEVCGFAGIPFYEAALYRRIKDRLIHNPSKDYEENLSDALDSYTEYLQRKIRTQHLNFSNDMRPQGILAVCFKALGLVDYRLFQFQPPDDLIEAEFWPRRAAIGSGGDVATVFLKTIEKFMDRAGIAKGWTQFSSHTIRQLVWILLEEASEIDPWSRGRDIEIITPGHVEAIDSMNPVFQSPEESHFSEFVGWALKDMSPDMPRSILEEFDLLDIVKGLRLD